MEQRKSSGVVVAGILGAATLKHTRQVHCSPKHKWYNLKDCRSKKGVQSLGFVGSRGRRTYWLELLSKIYILKIIVHVLGRSGCVCMFLGRGAYVYDH